MLTIVSVTSRVPVLRWKKAVSAKPPTPGGLSGPRQRWSMSHFQGDSLSLQMGDENVGANMSMTARGADHSSCTGDRATSHLSYKPKYTVW